LEAAYKASGQGESVQCPLTRKITFLFNPETTSNRLLNNDNLYVENFLKGHAEEVHALEVQ
jgi:hypothetical protein